MDFLTNPDFYRFASIPFVAALVGWGTNWLATKLLFYPVEPWGKPPWLGWQGIVPSKAEKMGVLTTESMLSKLGSLSEVFGTMEPKRIAAFLVERIEPQVEQLVEEVMSGEQEQIWALVPRTAKLVVYEMVRQRMPTAVDAMMEDVGEHIEEMVDLRQMVSSRLKEEPRLVNRIFLECGQSEFKFIVRSGLYFGFAFGLIQMAFWVLVRQPWVLPVFGLMVGYFTNWIALRIVFQPLKPIKIGPFKIQGLFLKRQREVAAIYCDIVTREVLTIRNIIHNMLYGSKSERTNQIIRKHVRRVVDESLGVTRPVVQLAVGSKEYDRLKESVSEKAFTLTATTFDDPAFNQSRAKIVREHMTERMEQLSPKEFQYLLRPAFEEEELKLILLGALLGFGTGVAQFVWVFKDVWLRWAAEAGVPIPPGL